MDYACGISGFVGSHLQQVLPVTAIPHEMLDQIALQPFNNFYFLSTYGNMFDQDDIDKTVRANVFDLVPILSQIARMPFNSFLFMSTSSVKLEFQTSYSRMKRAAEEIILAYMEKYNLPACILRPFSITGVGEQREHLIPSLIRSCLYGEHLDFVPTATHDFIDVSDVVGAIQNLTNHQARGVYEAGWGVSHTNQEVLEMVEKITKKKANVTVVPSLRPYDTEDWKSNNFRIRSWGWLPTITLKESITRMVKNE